MIALILFTADFLVKIENFIIGDLNDSDKKLEEILSFYWDDLDKQGEATFTQGHVIRYCKIKTVPHHRFQECFWSPFLHDMLPELVKFMRLVLTIPVSTSTAEWSFFSLQRLKSYTMSTMAQQQMNDVAIIHSHKEEALHLDLDEIANEFITRNGIRRQTFAMKT